MGDQAGFLARLRQRLRVAAETRDVSGLLDPVALEDAVGLRGFLEGGDGELAASLVLGDFYWQRARALGAEGAADRKSAVSVLAPCFTAGLGVMPRELLPELADAAFPEAIEMFHAASRSTDIEPLTVAIGVWRRVTDATPEDHEDYATRLVDLSVLLSKRYRCSGSMPDLDSAVAIDVLLAEREPEDPRYLINLCIDLCDRYEKTAVVRDIDFALQLADRALSLTPSNDPKRESRLYNRGRARDLGPWPARQREHLEDRGRLLREVNARCGRFIGFLEEMRAELSAFKPEDTEAVAEPSAAGDTLALCAMAPDLASDVEVLYAAGWLFWCRAIRLGEDGQSENLDLMLAVKLLCLLWYTRPDMVPPAIRQVMERHGREPEATRTAGVEASLALRSWYQETGEENALIAAIRLLRHEPKRLALGSGLRSAAVELLDRCLEVWEELHPGESAPSTTGTTMALKVLVDTLRALDGTGEEVTRQRMELCEKGLALLDGSEDNAIRISLASMLTTTIVAILEDDLPYHAHSVEEMVMRERAIGLLTRMLGELPDDYPVAQRAMEHVMLGTLYRARTIGSIGANEARAIKHGMAAVALADPAEDRTVWAMAMEKLAAVYVGGYTGDRTARFDEAIAMLEEVVDSLGDQEDSQLWCRVMSNLGEAYSGRPHGDRMADLVRAEQVFRKLANVETLEVNPAGWAQTQSCLAGVRGKMSDAEGTLRFLGLAEEGYRRAGISNPPPVHYQLLAAAHGSLGDTEKRVSVLRKLLDTTPREVYPVPWARAAFRLADALEESDPAEASELLQGALEALAHEPAATRDHAMASWSLARLHLSKGSAQDLSTAIELLEAGKEALEGDLPEIYVLICDELGGAYAKAGNWPRAANTFDAAVETLDRHYQMLLVFRSRAEEVSSTARIRHRAAYALARCGRTEEAVLMLESARARMVGEALTRDTADLRRVAEASPDAHAAFVRAAGQVRAAEVAGRDLFQAEAAFGASERGLHEAAQAAQAALAAAIADIRGLPGMSGFLDAPCMQDIGASPGQPVVYLAATQWGSLAIGVTAGSRDGGVAVTAAFADALTDADVLAALSLDPKSPPTAISGAELLSAVEQIGARLAAALAQFAKPPASRIILVPCGLLGVLPVHLLWIVPGGTRRLIDELPVIVALSGRRAAVTADTARPGTPIVIVSDPQQNLHFAQDEAAGISAWYPDASLMIGPEASIASVRRAVANAGGIHLACHGKQEAASPLTTGLELADGRLTVGQLLAEHPPLFSAARLLVMSACESAVIDPSAPDEALGLPAAMSYAGAPTVIGSLWRVDDAATAIFMASLYERLRGYGPAIPAWGPADALREAQLWMRGATVTEILRTIPAPSVRLRARLRLHDDSETPFADPRYWAAFTILGA
jgi:tetratricopeptide (TPR) repeat protein